MSHYTQLTQEKRYQIHALMKAGHNQAKIAEVLGRSKSTVSRELRRSQGLRGYRPQQAMTRRQAHLSHRITNDTWTWVERLSRKDWSPEQINL
jgi:IS30 family transposase